MRAPLLKDAYKVFHPLAYHPDVTHVHGNLTNRFGKYSNTGMDKVVHFGVQRFILKVLIGEWEKFFEAPKEEAIAEYSRVVNAMLGKEVDVTHMEDLHDLGYLPITIKSLPEGVLVPYGVPTLTISTSPGTPGKFGWVTNMIETVMSAEIWPMQTAATTAFAYRKRFEDSVLSEVMPEMIPFLGHDFSYRGMMGTEAASMTGLGHLLSFAGSDTIPAALAAEDYYGAEIDKELVFASVDATEHSVETSSIFIIEDKLIRTGKYNGKTVEELWEL